MILLCSKEELPAAFGLCRNLCFDDYVLYWPFTHDALRLPTSIRTAYREMTGMNAESERTEALMKHVRYVEDHESRVGHESSADMGKVTAAHRALLLLEHELVNAGDEVSAVHTAGAATLAPKAKLTSPPPAQQDIDHVNRSRTGAWALTGSIRGDRPLLLVVEGDPLTRDLIAQSLNSDIYDVLFVRDAIDALHNLKFTRPQCILVDMKLPRMNGMSFTQYLKATVHLSKIPVIMMITDTRSETLKSCMRAGASELIAKPFTPESLIAKLERAFAR